MIEFRDDDAGYLAWVESHSQGYVLNVRRHPDPDYVILHRASCGSIARRSHRPGAYTERQYRKICAFDLETLERAAIQEGRRDGSFSRRCRLCQP